jgi:glycosyltransferase involved in cell wall biosynthesis
MPPTLSVVMPNFNHARFLPESVGALLSQSDPASEIIVMDDCSTDDSWDVLQTLAARHPTLRCHRNKKNQGVVPNMNCGLALAQGDYVYFAAADDKVLPGFFEHTMHTLRAHPQAALGCSIGNWVDVATGSSRQVGEAMGAEPCYLSPERMVELEKQGRLLIASQTVIVKRAALLRAGGFQPELRWFCDWFANYVAGFREGICFVPQTLTVFNVHPASYSKAGRSQKKTRREVLRELIARLDQRENADAARLIHDSGALYLFGKPALTLMLATPRWWRHLTPAFLRKTLATMAQAERKKWRRSWEKHRHRWQRHAMADNSGAK